MLQDRNHPVCSGVASNVSPIFRCTLLFLDFRRLTRLNERVSNGPLHANLPLSLLLRPLLLPRWSLSLFTRNISSSNTEMRERKMPLLILNDSVFFLLSYFTIFFLVLISVYSCFVVVPFETFAKYLSSILPGFFINSCQLAFKSVIRGDD